LTKLTVLIWTFRSGSERPSAAMSGTAGCRAVL
jgi:hypothetical protein